jgi:hypothetical protein
LKDTSINWIYKNGVNSNDQIEDGKINRICKKETRK